MPITSTPIARPTSTAARIAAFMPGASPPLVRIPTRLHPARCVCTQAWRRVCSGAPPISCYSRPMVRTERAGRVTTVILDRHTAKNAVDRDTAQARADAFRAFEADDEARVAVLYGDH